MKPGTVYREFTARSGANVKLRAPQWEDLDDFMDLMEELVELEAMIARNEKRPWDVEIENWARIIKDTELDKSATVVAEVDGCLVGHTGFHRRGGWLSHVASLGTIVRIDYRNMGIGGEMLREVEVQARRLGVEVLTLEVYDVNPAMRLYKRHGYREYGRLPGGVCYRDVYHDVVSMYKNIDESG